MSQLYLWQQRLLDEKEQLEQRLRKLVVFIHTDSEFKKLTEKDQNLLRKQMDAMTCYLEILKERVAAFTP
jgi:hypothetical protein